jgi:hypothetical protein
MLGRVLVVISICAAAGGCATSFNSDISKTVTGAQFAVAKCEKNGQLVGVESTTVTIALNFDPSESAYVQTQPSDLQLGVDIINSSNKAGGRLKALSTDISNKLGFDLAQFQDQVLLVDDDGAAAAQSATSADSAKALMAISANDGARISRADWNNFTQSVAHATATSGWTASFAKALGATARAQLARDSSSKAAVEDANKKYLLAAYMVAYFRNGQIFQLNFDDQGLKTKLMDKLKQKIIDPQILAAASTEIDAVTTDFEKKLCGNTAANATSCNILGVLGQQTFVTRAGKSYGFPGVSATIDPTATKKVSTNKLNTNDIIQDLIRVFFEATGDGAFSVPGAANSTLCKERSNLCSTAANAGAVESADNSGDATEAATTTVVSAVVRGGWLFSLNNETLADSITTATAVVARKIAEEAAYKKATASCDTSNQAHRNVAVTVMP